MSEHELSPDEVHALGVTTAQRLGVDVLTGWITADRIDDLPVEVLELSTVELRGVAEWLRRDIVPRARGRAGAVAMAAEALDNLATVRRHGGGL